MPINIGKNLKIIPTNDAKVSNFVRNYNEVHDYIEEHCSRQVVYYAYYFCNGCLIDLTDYSDPFYSLDYEHAFIVYCEKEITSSSGESTGIYTFYYQPINLYGYPQSGTSISKNVSEVLSSHHTEMNVITLKSDGFKLSFERAIRCPNLDIYDDGTVGNGEPFMYAYYSVHEDSENGDHYVCTPVPMEKMVGEYHINLYSLDTYRHPTFEEYNSYGYYEGEYDDPEQISDTVFKSYYADWETMTRDSSFDLTDIGTPSESPLKLYDLLMALLPSYTISYSNLPTGATFVWTCDGETISNNVSVKQGQLIEYTLTYADGSKCVDSFIASDDFVLDLSTLEANKFILTITANKTLKSVYVYHNYVDSSTPHETYNSFTNNTLSLECDKNENVRISACSDGWSQTAQNTSPMNLQIAHYYNNISSNISETYAFDYVAYNSTRIFLKDENNNNVTLTSAYSNYITYTPSDSSKWVNHGIISQRYYNTYIDNNESLDYVINIPNYAPVSGTFASTSSPVYNPIEQTKTLVPMVTYTIVPYPSDATVTLAASGYTQSGNSITVPKGTSVVWMVAKEGYETQSGNVTVTSTQSVNVVLEESTIYGVDVTDYN